MKAKKFLKQQAEAEKKEILEASDMQSFDEFFTETEKPVQPKRSFFKRYYKWLISAAGVAVCAIILTTVLLLYPAKDKIVYDEHNFVTSSSTIEEMDSDMKEIDFHIDNAEYSVEIEKTTDSVSGDSILYSAWITQRSARIKFEFVAVCNSNYSYSHFDITNFTHIDLSGLSVYYKKDIITDDETSLNQAICLAQIQKGSEFIFITEYTEYMLDEESSLLEIIQEMFI